MPTNGKTWSWSEEAKQRHRARRRAAAAKVWTPAMRQRAADRQARLAKVRTRDDHGRFAPEEIPVKRLADAVEAVEQELVEPVEPDPRDGWRTFRCSCGGAVTRPCNPRLPSPDTPACPRCGAVLPEAA